jgi:hypothetical protein
MSFDKFSKYIAGIKSNKTQNDLHKKLKYTFSVTGI